jgi:4-aminobutyrate aminotransferase-like enzyme
MSDLAGVRQKQREYLWPASATYYQESVVLDSGSGCVLRDGDGREYLDFFGGILTVGLGHCNERVNAAAETQMRRLGHVSSVYPTLPVVALAEKLASITPGPLRKSYFVTSGTEAVETAVGVAQIFTGSLEILALRHGYSGRSMMAQALTGHASWRAAAGQGAAVKHAPAPYCYRCPFGLEYPSCALRCADDLEEIIQTSTSGKVAAFLAEPILGVGGFITPPDDYFQRAVEIVRRYGGLFICDEVQTGFGRTGKMFGIKHYGVEPDIMTMAKGIANGMPLAVCIARPEIADSFQKLTISTFGGNPIAAAAANETIDIIEGENLLARVEERGERLREGLLELKERFGGPIGDVRGKGLMLGVELVKNEAGGDRTPAPAAVARIFEETKQRGLLLGKGGLFGNVLRVAPPLIVDDAQIDAALGILGESFAALGRV